MFFDNQQMMEIKHHLKEGVVNLLLIAEHSEIDVTELISYANSNNYLIAGGIFPMVISGDKHFEKGCVFKYIKSSHSPQIVEGVGQGNLELTLNELTDEDHSCLVFLDGLMLNIPQFLEELYEKYWNRVNYIGAGCGSLSLQQTKCVFNNDGIYQDSALVILSSDDMSLGVKHGWKKIAGPFVANKAEGNKIYELNWRPAYEVYKEVVEAHCDLRFDSEDFFSISKGFPFGIYKEGKEDIVRDPIAVDENGALLCVGNISQNVSLNILKGNEEKLIESAEEAAREANVATAKDTLIVDCISRVLYLEDMFKGEVQAVNKVLFEASDNLSLEGVLSIGEISSGQGGYLELYNKTIVVSAFK